MLTVMAMPFHPARQANGEFGEDTLFAIDRYCAAVLLGYDFVAN
jgi:hypothetical protein